MKKGTVALIVVAVVGVALFFSFKGNYNEMVVLDEGVSSAWAQVENQYQRRADLIPNLVSTVKGYADFEQKTLTAVVEARSKATSITVDPSNLTPETVAKFQKAQDGLSGALSRLLVSVERYPDLKANTQFQQLQVQLEGTENRIAVERRNFNNTVQGYNAMVRQFPRNIIAGILGFGKKGYFESTVGSENAPEVSFE